MIDSFKRVLTYRLITHRLFAAHFHATSLGGWSALEHTSRGPFDEGPITLPVIRRQRLWAPINGTSYLSKRLLAEDNVLAEIMPPPQMGYTPTQPLAGVVPRVLHPD